MSARRERILESARQIIEEEGVAALTMRRLADDAGLTPPTLYNLLGSRTEILRALFWSALDALDARLAELPPEATGLDRAERIVTASVDIFTAAPATFRPAIAALLADHLENGSSIRAQETWRRCRDLQIAACRQAREEGDLVGAIESEWLGEEILTCYSAALRGWVQGDLSAAQFRARALHGLFVCALSDASNARRKALHARAAEARRAFAEAAASDAAA